MRALARTLSCFLAAIALASPVGAGTRLKDIIDIEGVRENQLTGYGIVFGLNGSGDSIRNCPMLQQGLASMLERLGINTRDSTVNTKNVAAVMVTASLPPFAQPGQRIDPLGEILVERAAQPARADQRRMTAGRAKRLANDLVVGVV